jgi:hypothetical protein|tara:strand:+ start:217 stop:618 length:402 start_codon:yes stop_codon:yes gene_type:complete
MSNIPAEYANMDFGFSAVDEAEFKSNQHESETTPPTIDENDLNRIVLNSLAPLEDKIDRLLSRQQLEDSDDVQFAVAQAEEEVKGKVSELEKIIMPLLVNLMKTADKEYIHWPNREKQVQGTIDKVLALTRGK